MKIFFCKIGVLVFCLSVVVFGICVEILLMVVFIMELVRVFFDIQVLKENGFDLVIVDYYVVVL